MLKTVESLLMKMSEYIINGHGTTEIIEENHFLIQTIRIPKNEEPTLKKNCQIALNIVHYLGYTKKNIENNSIENYLLKSDYNVLLKDILQEKEILKLKSLL